MGVLRNQLDLLPALVGLHLAHDAHRGGVGAHRLDDEGRHGSLAVVVGDGGGERLGNVGGKLGGADVDCHRRVGVRRCNYLVQG